MAEHSAFPRVSAPLTPAIRCCAGPGHRCNDPQAWRTPEWQQLDFEIDEPHQYQYSYESDGKTFTARGRRRQRGHHELTGTIDGSGKVLGMRGRRLYHFHDTSSSARLKQKQPIDDNRALRPEGDNLAPFLFALRTVAPGAYHRIVEAVRAVAPFFDDFALAPDTLNPELIQLEWRHVSHDRQFGPAALSDGTLRFMCLATLLLQPELPATILIDEPELGLHPLAIHQLGALVRSAAVDTQIILATQSVTLLDEFNPAEIVVYEQHEGASEFRRVEEHALAAWRDEYSLGELWLKNGPRRGRARQT